MKIYDKAGQKITTEQWSELLRDPSYQVIAQDRGAGLLISTVWLGLDHNFGGNGPPVIFETMIFAEGDTDAREERDQFRYSTEAEALEGHKRLVKKYLDIIRKIGRLDEKTPEEIEADDA